MAGLNILICTEGGTFGLGHVKRQLVLARELARHGAAIRFVHPLHEVIGWETIVESGFPVSDVESPAETLIVDVEEYPGRDRFVDWRARYARVVLFGGVTYPPVGHHELIDLEVYQGELFDYPEMEAALNGPDYLIIDPAYRNCRPDFYGHIVISMGGRDPFNLTATAHAALASLPEKSLVTVFGPAFNQMDPPLLRYETRHFAPSLLAPLLEGAALCVCATGMTAYEALCAGVPVVLGDISEDHRRTALGLQERGVALDVGLPAEFTAKRCATAVRSLLPHGNYAGVQRHANWEGMSQRARVLVDGHGVERVAEKIMRPVKNENPVSG